MANRDEALGQIAAIARAHGLSAADIAAELEAAPADSARSGHLLGRILAYLGGIFVLAGLGVFIALNWSAMSGLARIVISLGSGVAAFVLALIAHGEERYRAARAPLMLLAAALQPTGMLVAIHEFSTGGDWRYAVLLTAGVMFAQQGLALRKLGGAILLFTTLLFALSFFGVALDLLGARAEWIALVLGAALVGLCAGLEKGPYRDTTPFCYLVGAGAVYGGLFAVLEGTRIELLFLLAACGGLVLSTHLRSRSLLIVSTVAILGFISYFTHRHFLHSFGWPLVLVVSGLILIGLSTLALRLDRRYIARR